MFNNALEKVSASITNIIRITQITFEFVNVCFIVDLSLIFILKCLSKASVIECKMEEKLSVYNKMHMKLNNYYNLSIIVSYCQPTR